MESKIRILSDDLIAKIAAGEVVERPASVVKELIENSLDAQATRIDIEIKNGGRNLIRVSDNGIGMTPDDARISLTRHATSKIRSADDLFAIQTLGFRGEALPSIAAVSRMALTTRSRDAASGLTLLIEGGNVTGDKAAGTPEGTTISVEDLFFNTPARLKFLKKPATEFSHISDVVTQAVLIRPAVGFMLTHNGRTVLKTEGSADLREAVAAIYGPETAAGMKPLSFESPEMRITGLVSSPLTHRLDRSGQSFFVNGRPVKNFLLSRALDDGYAHRLPREHYPIAVISIDIDPALVDVNVHPTKREVKFAHTYRVLDALREAVTAVWADSPRREFFEKIELPDHYLDSIEVITAASPPESEAPSAWLPRRSQSEWPRDTSAAATQPGHIPALLERSALADGPVIQIDNTYIMTALNGAAVIVDQHAAHERVLYEKLRGKDAAVAAVQPLLIPETVDLSPAEEAALEAHAAILTELGFAVESFGPRLWQVRAVPAILTGKNVTTILRLLIQQLGESSRGTALTEVRERALILMACHGSVRAGDPLTPVGMRQILADLAAAPRNETCPHGRPTRLAFTPNDLAKLFKRI